MAPRMRNAPVDAPGQRQARGPRRARRVQPPLTAMIDVTFQLLLFFLLACEFRESEGQIPGSLPGAGRPVDIRPIEVTLRRSGQVGMAYYQLSGAAEVITSPQELYRRLRGRQEALQSRDVPLVIRPEPTVPWEFVVEAFNQAVRAEFTRVALQPDGQAEPAGA